MMCARFEIEIYQERKCHNAIYIEPCTVNNFCLGREIHHQVSFRYAVFQIAFHNLYLHEKILRVSNFIREEQVSI